jgi:hypothetical protein
MLCRCFELKRFHLSHEEHKPDVLAALITVERHLDAMRCARNMFCSTVQDVQANVSSEIPLKRGALGVHLTLDHTGAMYNNALMSATVCSLAVTEGCE